MPPSQLFHGCFLSPIAIWFFFNHCDQNIHTMESSFYLFSKHTYCFSIDIMMTVTQVLFSFTCLSPWHQNQWECGPWCCGPVIRPVLNLCPVLSFQWNPRFTKSLYHHSQIRSCTHWAADRSWPAPFMESPHLPSRGSGTRVTIITPKQGRHSSFLK